MWEKFQKFLPRGLQDISIQIHFKHFIGLAKNRASALHKLTFLRKNVQNGGASLDSFSETSWLYA